MFQHEGPQRTDRHNQLVAGYLASIAGLVNSAGFILIGSFTSHVTGNIGRFADDVALGRSVAPLALVLVVAFYAGALFASMALESSTHSRPRTYSLLLVVESALLGSFAFLSYAMNTQEQAFRDVQAILLCVAMGMQNSFVTRLSGAVVRTTHLTGVVTDLGIETARWLRHWRALIGARTGTRLTFGDAAVTRPQRAKTILLLTIVVAFVVGSTIGALTAAHWGELALLLPALALMAAALRSIKVWRVENA